MSSIYLETQPGPEGSTTSDNFCCCASGKLFLNARDLLEFSLSLLSVRVLLAKPQRSKFSIGPEPVANEAVYIATTHPPKKRWICHTKWICCKVLECHEEPLDMPSIFSTRSLCTRRNLERFLWHNAFKFKVWKLQPLIPDDAADIKYREGHYAPKWEYTCFYGYRSYMSKM